MRVLDDDKITVRTANFMISKDTENFEDLADISTDEVMKWANLGRRTVEEILQLMKKYNIFFRWISGTLHIRAGTWYCLYL